MAEFQAPRGYEQGLSKEQVSMRTATGKTNQTTAKTNKTTGQIIRENTLTYFNGIFLCITVLLCAVGSFRNLTFLPIILGNTLIGIIQELRAKAVLDKMNLLAKPHTCVVRDGKELTVAAEELVLDDIIVLHAGDQIPADAVLLDGTLCVNESLLSGESDEIAKACGDELLSGSFVTAGQGRAMLSRVGDDSYIMRLSAQAKQMKGTEQSEMIRSVNRIIKWVGIAVIPIAIILFCQSYFINHETVQRSITSMVAAIIGMIPEGLYLLTTIALALSTIRLVRKKVLLHDMKSIETLARVDVLCVDKTGTITEPDMRLCKILPVFDAPADEKTATLRLCEYAHAATDSSSTMQALRRYADRTNAPAVSKPLALMPFSSAQKYGAIRFSDGTYLFGAPEVLLGDGIADYTKQLAPALARGERVLAFCFCRGEIPGEPQAVHPAPLLFVTFSNPLRQNAARTFSYFAAQGVTVKVISGDHPATVCAVAAQAGIPGAERFVDARTLTDEAALRSAAANYTVFGRVTPAQKQQLVRALQDAGHTVAMTGDGVNDILAMKDADCSVAMASGSEAATQAAQLVLMDNDFAKMPDIVSEGRRVVNNIQRSASLFLVKNIFSLLMALFSAVFFFTYPLEPAQISLISAFTIGLPGFLLALEPSTQRITGNFMKNVLLRALPAGLTDLFSVAALVVCGEVFSLPGGDIATAATMLLCVVGFMILIKISKPFNRFKWAILAVNIAGLLFCGIFLHQLFAMSAMSAICILLMVVFAFASESMFRYLTLFTEFLTQKLEALRQKHRAKMRK